MGHGGSLGRGQKAGNSGASATRSTKNNSNGAGFQVGRATRNNAAQVTDLKNQQRKLGTGTKDWWTLDKEIGSLSSPTSGTLGLIADSPYGPVMSEYGRQTGYRGNLGAWQAEQARKKKGPQSGRRLEDNLNAYHDQFFPAAEA